MIPMPELSTARSLNADTVAAPWWWRRADWLYASIVSGTMLDAQADPETKHPVEVSTSGR